MHPALPRGRRPIGKHDSVDRARARSGDTLEMKGFFFEQAVEYAPGESAVTTATLQRQVHNFGYSRGLCSFCGRLRYAPTDWAYRETQMDFTLIG